MATHSRHDSTEAREVEVEVLPKEREGIRFEGGAGGPAPGARSSRTPWWRSSRG